MPNYLTNAQLRFAVAAIAQKLDELGIDYAIMGGAAVCITGTDLERETEDIDLVIQVDQRNITADQTTSLLLQSSTEFVAVSQYGHIIPGYRLATEGVERLVEIEIFDYQSWPQRPQYNLATATRRTIDLQGQPVKFFGPEWILREKILSQYQRQGSAKELQDIRDAMQMLRIAQPNAHEMNFEGNEELEEALKSFLRKRPEARGLAKQKLQCNAVFK